MAHYNHNGSLGMLHKTGLDMNVSIYAKKATFLLSGSVPEKFQLGCIHEDTRFCTMKISSG